MLHTSLLLLLVCAALGHISLAAATGFIINRAPERLLAVNGFSWANCDAETLPGKIQKLTILPDPMLIPGEITATALLNTSVALTSPTKIQVTAKKEIMGEWMKIPCLDNFGSCTYDDFCDILDELIMPGVPCPEPMRSYGLPCHCPFQSGTYYLPVSSFYIPSLALPYWFSDGNYALTIVITNGKLEIGCAKITFSIAASYSHWL